MSIGHEINPRIKKDTPTLFRILPISGDTEKELRCYFGLYAAQELESRSEESDFMLLTYPETGSIFTILAVSSYIVVAHESLRENMELNALYLFLTGPGLWITFVIFIGGLILRLVYLFGLSRGRDRVFYNHMSISWAMKSILRWLIPLGSASLRSQPAFSLVFFIFHGCLLGVPLFLLAHNMLWDEVFGVSLLSMREYLADVFTFIFIGCAIFLFARRRLRPEVRILTTFWDYALLVLTTLPFATGFLASHQWGHYEVTLMIHVLSAEILLIIIPFSKLGHIILFFFARAFIGFEMGSRRGARPW